MVVVQSQAAIYFVGWVAVFHSANRRALMAASELTATMESL